MQDTLEGLSFAAPFPPIELMQRVSTLTNTADFAKHGRDLFEALSKASPQPLHDFTKILDFGVGCGRLARMFRGYRGRYYGVDIDQDAIAWIDGALPWVRANAVRPLEALPYVDAQFDCVMAVSVFTHMREVDSAFYLRELQRVSGPDAVLLLTVHGARAIERAQGEQRIAEMLAIPAEEISTAAATVEHGGFHFSKQPILSTKTYDYGISFTSEAYVRRVWGELFEVVGIVAGAIHDFQDIVVLRR